MNIDIACPKCSGSGMGDDDMECEICLGYGDFAQGTLRHIQICAEEGGRYDNQIMQVVAKYLIEKSKGIRE